MTTGVSPKASADAGHSSSSPLRQRDFRLFWTGLVLSGIGSQFTTVAMAWQIYELTNSAFQIGLLGLARAIPQAVMLLVGGLLADAMNRRKLMVCTQASLFVISSTLALLTLAGHGSASMLYVATILLALVTSLESPARHALVPNLVPREQLTKALALNSSQRYVAVIAGPSLAGLVLAVAGPAACYAIDALSWLVMLWSLSRIRTPMSEGGGWGTVSLGALSQGLSFVRGHAIILPLMVMDFCANFFGSAKALLPVFARDILAVGPQGLGMLYSASAVGSLLSAVALGRFGPVSRGGLWIFGGVGVYGLSTALFAGSQTFWLSLLLLALAGAGDTVSAIMRGTINQLVTPDELRGRMISINSVFTNSGPALGQFESGLVAAWLGAELSALTGGLATLVMLALVVALFPAVRRYRVGTASRRQ